MIADRKSAAGDFLVSSQPPGALTEPEEFCLRLFQVIERRRRHSRLQPPLPRHQQGSGRDERDPCAKPPGKNRARGSWRHWRTHGEEALASNGDARGIEIRAFRAAPSRREIGHRVVDMFPISSSQGSVTRIGVIVYELTAPKILEESLQSLEGELRREPNDCRC